VNFLCPCGDGRDGSHQAETHAPAALCDRAGGGIEAAAEPVPAAALLVRTDNEAQMFEPLDMPEPQPESDDDG
jgi:hypothetical protein